MLDGRKLGGILTEASAESGRIRNLIVGVGINYRRVALDLPTDAPPPAFLFDHAARGEDSPLPEAFAGELSQSIRNAMVRLLGNGDGGRI